MTLEVQTQYDLDKNLQKDVVLNLMEWAKAQSDLPNINELQTILFLHSCYYDVEATKSTIKNFFGFRSQNRELFTNRNPSSPEMLPVLNHTLFATLPKRTPENYTIFFVKFMEDSARNFDLRNQIKYFNMVVSTHLQTEGVSSGLLLLVDIRGLTFGHLLKLRPGLLKKVFYYLQEALPVRLKGFHFFNVIPLMNRLLVLIKPLLKKELLDVLYLHNRMEGLQEFVPLECLPEDYGGSIESVSVLHEKVKDQLGRSTEFLTDD